MAKYLLIISAVLIAATAYLGFATKQKIDLLQGDLSKTKSTLAQTQADLKKTKDTLKKTEEELIAAKATIDEKEKDIAAKKVEIDKLSSDLKTAQTDLEEKTKSLAELKAQLDEVLKGTGGDDPKKLTEAVEKLKSDLAKKETELAEQKQISASLTENLTAEKTKTQSAETQVRGYKENIVRIGLSGTILAYNPGWNFVVISIGDKQGLKAGKEMVVKRGGQMIGKVKVTAVEPGSSIADVIPGSIAKGSSVQPGDAVVFEGRGN